MKVIIKSLWGFWLGFSLAVIGFGFLTWQFWFVFLPLLILINFWDIYELLRPKKKDELFKEMLKDQMIYGRSVVRISQDELLKEQTK